MRIPAQRIVQSTAPTTEAIALEELKVHLRIDTNDEDAYIESRLRAAVQYYETATGRALMPRTYTATLDDWPWDGRLIFPYPPLISVTSVKYTDSDGVTLTFAASNYTVDVAMRPGRLVLSSLSTWPSVTLADINGVEVIWTAGYTELPDMDRSALLLLAAHLYENREAVTIAQGISVVNTPLAFESMLLADREHWF
jgi:uncharacterized phiE125 gp8 family phage protein